MFASTRHCFRLSSAFTVCLGISVPWVRTETTYEASFSYSVAGMANSHHPNGSLYALPNELKLAIVEALILHRDPVPAVAIFNAESYIAVRALQKVCKHFRAAFATIS